MINGYEHDGLTPSYEDQVREKFTTELTAYAQWSAKEFLDIVEEYGLDAANATKVINFLVENLVETYNEQHGHQLGLDD